MLGRNRHFRASEPSISREATLQQENLSRNQNQNILSKLETLISTVLATTLKARNSPLKGGEGSVVVSKLMNFSVLLLNSNMQGVATAAQSGSSLQMLDENHLKRVLVKKLCLNKSAPAQSTLQQQLEKYFGAIMSNPGNLLADPLKCCWFIYYMASYASTASSLPYLVTSTATPSAKSGQSLVSAFAAARLHQTTNAATFSAGKEKVERNSNTMPPSESDDKSSRLAAVFNSYYIPNHVVNAGFTLVSETDLLRDLLFVFQGIDGAFIQFTQPSSSTPFPNSTFNTTTPSQETGYFVLRSDVKIPKPTREMVQHLCVLGWVYRMIVQEMDARTQLGVVDGLYGQALIASIQKELQEYKRLVCVLESQLESHITNSPTFISSSLSLKRLFVWTRGPLFKLSILLALCQMTRGKRGSQILDVVHSYATHGDAQVRSYTSSLLTEISRPFYEQLVGFLKEGRVSDPFDEFFCTINHEVGLEDSAKASISNSSKSGGTSHHPLPYWKSKVSLQKQNVPAFMSLETAKKCFQVGKSVEFLGNALHLPPPSTHLSLLAPLTGLTSPNTNTRTRSLNLHQLDKCVAQACKSVSPYLVQKYLEKARVVEAFRVVCEFMLLGKGDFVLFLMEQLQETLEKPAQTIYRHDLVGVLESAVRDCNSGCDAALLARLDVCLLENQDEMAMGLKGWDVFSLDYRISHPLDTVFSPSSMRIYQKVFSFLWRVKRVGYRLLQGYKNGNSSSHARNLLLHKMIHFTSILTQHLFQALATQQQFFLSSLEKADDLDAVIQVHVLFLRRVCEDVLFASHRNGNVFASILGVLESVCEMEACMRPVASGGAGGALALRMGLGMGTAGVDVQELASAFDGKVKEFLQVLGEAGYGELVSKLDFNEVFEG